MKEDQFIKITRYKCIWCGGEYKTDHRHRCRFDPAFRSCYSCEYCSGIEKIENTYSVPFAGSEVLSPSLRNMVEAWPKKKIACALGHEVFTADIAGKKNDLQCCGYRTMDGYEGKKTYYERAVLQKRLQREDDDVPVCEAY